jgi:hypothetical protein
VVFEVAEAVALPIDELHLVVEAFGDAIIADEAPYGDDLLAPGMRGLAQLYGAVWFICA